MSSSRRTRQTSRRFSAANHWYTLVPTAFVSAVTLTSLVLLASQAFAAEATVAQRVNGVVAVALLVLAGQVLGLGVRAVLRREQSPAAALA